MVSLDHFLGRGYVIAASLLTLIACAPAAEAEAQSAKPPAPTTTAAESSIQKPDLEVLHAVFGDLLSLNDEESPVAIRGRAPERISFSMTSATWRVTVEQILRPHQKERWKALSQPQSDGAREAAEQVVARRDNAERFHPFPLDPRVIVWETRVPPTNPARFDRPIRAYPPGYSHDRRFAIVNLSIPWSIHHADGTYLLENVDGRWKVVLRQFIYYV